MSLPEVNGMKVHYYEWGNSTKPTIVFLHGLSNNGLSFIEVADDLQNEFHILAIDAPGHGKTPPLKKEEDYMFSNLVKWYEEVFNQLLDKPFYLIGHSWGADLALHFSKQFPEKIEGLILLDGGFTFPDYQEGMTYSKVINGWNYYMDNKSVFETWEDVKNEYKQFTKRWDDRIEEMVVSLFNLSDKYELITSKFTILSIVKAFFIESFTQTYNYIKAPVLLIHATIPYDQALARITGIQHITNKIQNVQIIKMEETNHLVHWDDPRFVSKEIHRWVDKIETAKP